MAPTQNHKESLTESFSAIAAKLIPQPFYDVIYPRDEDISSLNDAPNICDLEPPRTYSMKEVSEHNHYDSCWLVLSDKVYDVTQFMHVHPGGLEIVLDYGGRDATYSFAEKGHSGRAYKMLSKYYIGDLIEADKIDK